MHRQQKHQMQRSELDKLETKRFQSWHLQLLCLELKTELSLLEGADGKGGRQCFKGGGLLVPKALAVFSVPGLF